MRREKSERQAVSLLGKDGDVKASDLDKKFDEGEGVSKYLQIRKSRRANKRSKKVGNDEKMAKLGGAEKGLEPIPRRKS